MNAEVKSGTSWSKRWLRRLRTLALRRTVERELDEEVAFHLEMEAEKLRRSGLDPAEARRRAAVAFGGVEDAKEKVREARFMGWAPGLGLDLRLGARMLLKAPGLALVGGLGMAVAVAISAGVFTLANAMYFPTIPLAEGERIVSLVELDRWWGGYMERVAHDYGVWRRELRNVVDLGAFRTVERNLVGRTGDVEPIQVAEMSASGFRVARVPPLLGRTLVDADEVAGAPAVIVISEREWRGRFDGDPKVVGRTMRLASGEHTIVGVMPEGFAFPINHRYWVPLRVPTDTYEPASGPELKVFGRLAPGVSADTAQAEMSVIGKRLAAERKGTKLEHLEARVVPYCDIVTHAAAEGETETMRVMRFVLVLLLVVVAMNVGVLVYARTMNRSAEIAVRTALGATRGRIVGQLFAEALVLSTVAALGGLGMVVIAMRWFDRFVAESFGDPPFWMQTGLSVPTVAHALALALVAAAIVGLFPALRATRPQLRTAIGSAGGGSEARLGATWTALIVVQVAAAVAILPPALLRGWELASQSWNDPGLPAGEILATTLTFDPDEEASPPAGGDPASKAAAEQAAFARRKGKIERLFAALEAEPGIAGVALASSNPWSGGYDPVEVEGRKGSGNTNFLHVGIGWFELYGVRPLQGRSFVAADAVTAVGEKGPALPQVVIVNRSFVDELLGGGPAVGTRVRYRSSGDEPQPWLEIVGVVDDFPAGFRVPAHSSARLYHPVAAGVAIADDVALRVGGGTPAELTRKLRRIAAQVDPLLQVSDAVAVDAAYADEMSTMGRIALGLAIAVGSVLLLSAAGIHALVSFTVSKRRREIGIRGALGASKGRILAGVLTRASRQLAVGVVAGLTLAFVLDRATGGDLLSGTARLLLPAAGACALLVGLLAAAGPARRALRVQPTEAIRTE